MRFATFLLALAATMLATACLQKWPSERKVRYVPIEQCSRAGGTVEIGGGLDPSPMCIIRNPDANKACTDSSQCVGRCLFDHDESEQDLKRGDKATGFCEHDNATFGCFAEVVRGRLTGEICVD